MVNKKILLGTINPLVFFPVAFTVSCGSQYSEMMNQARIKLNIEIGEEARKVSSISELEKILKVGVVDGFRPNVTINKIEELDPKPNDPIVVNIFYTLKLPINPEKTQFETCDNCNVIATIGS